MDPSDHYADAISTEPGRYFRMVASSEPGKRGAPIHCPNRVEWRGRVKDGSGVWHEVESCTDHAGDVTDWRPVETR
jgi:hypothetical protein